MGDLKGNYSGGTETSQPRVPPPCPPMASPHPHPIPPPPPHHTAHAHTLTPYNNWKRGGKRWRENGGQWRKIMERWRESGEKNNEGNTEKATRNRITGGDNERWRESPGNGGKVEKRERERKMEKLVTPSIRPSTLNFKLHFTLSLLFPRSMAPPPPHLNLPRYTYHPQKPAGRLIDT